MSAADQSLPRTVIEAAVDAVAPGGQGLRQLADALAADPGALAAGAPPVAGRLAAELIARGSATLAIPACTVCGRAGKPLFRGDGGGVCQRCRARQVARPCATCGKVKPAAGFDEDGRAVCEVCRRRDDPRRHRECAMCGKTAPVAVRGRGGRAGICTSCCQRPEATCSKCQQRRPGARAATSQPACPSCSPRAAAACARCGPDRPPRARWPEGPVCDPCCRAALHHRGHAHGADSSAGWSLRPARALTPAPIAPGSRSSAPAPAAAPKTSSRRKDAARRARCAAGPGSCWLIPPAPPRRPWPACWRRSRPPASLASP